MTFEKQIQLPECGAMGQVRLQKATVLVVGMGGLGCAVLPNLVGMGIGRLILIDGDTVHESNLHRQFCFEASDIGAYKVAVAQRFALARNPQISIETHAEILSKHNADQLIAQADVVVDCTDNAYAKYLLDEHCKRLKKPLVYGAVGGFEGYISVFHHHKGYFFSDLYPDKASLLAADTCNQSGVFGFLCSLVGGLQSAEVFKILVTDTDVTEGELLIIEALQGSIHRFKLQRINAVLD